MTTEDKEIIKEEQVEEENESALEPDTNPDDLGIEGGNDGIADGSQLSLKDKLSSVAGDKKRLAVLAALFASFIATLSFYFLFSKSSDNNADQIYSDGLKSDIDFSAKYGDSGGNSPSTTLQKEEEIPDEPKKDGYFVDEARRPVAQPDIPLPPPLPTPMAPSNPLTVPIPKPQPPKQEIKQSLTVVPTVPPSSGGVSSSEMDIKPPIDSLQIMGESKEEKAAKLARISSGIMVFGGASGGDALEGGFSIPGSGAKDSKDKDNPAGRPAPKQFLGFDDGKIDVADILGDSESENVTATQVKNLDRSIIQGKVIDGVLETAITTQIDEAGVVRAIISRDVYAEQGKNVLIPKGSRIVGNYETSVDDGQTRVMVTWERIITPRGIDVKIDAKSADRLGRLGVPGFVDDKIASKLMSAFLVSYIIPLAVLEATGGSDDVINKSEDDDKTSSTTTARAQLLSDASESFSETAEEAVKKRYPDKTVVSVDQGALIKIIATKDLIFPTAAIDHNTGSLE